MVVVVVAAFVVVVVVVVGLVIVVLVLAVVEVVVFVPHADGTKALTTRPPKSIDFRRILREDGVQAPSFGCGFEEVQGGAAQCLSVLCCDCLLQEGHWPKHLEAEASLVC